MSFRNFLLTTTLASYLILSAACGGKPVTQTPTPSTPPRVTITASPSFTSMPSTATFTPPATFTPTSTYTPRPTATFTPSPTLTPTPQPVCMLPGETQMKMYEPDPDEPGMISLRFRDTEGQTHLRLVYYWCPRQLGNDGRPITTGYSKTGKKYVLADMPPANLVGLDLADECDPGGYYLQALQNGIYLANGHGSTRNFVPWPPCYGGRGIYVGYIEYATFPRSPDGKPVPALVHNYLDVGVLLSPP